MWIKLVGASMFVVGIALSVAVIVLVDMNDQSNREALLMGLGFFAGGGFGMFLTRFFYDFADLDRW